MSRRAIVTVVTRNYLAFARALMRQCAVHEPDAGRFVVVADRLPLGEVADVPDAEVIFGDELGIDGWSRYAFQYTPFELTCALKPHAFRFLMSHRGADAVVYLDADMGLYGPLAPVWEALEKDSIVLTPHLHRPMPDGGLQPYESLFAFSGTFNGGFCAVRDTGVGRSFTGWWASMLRKFCIDDLRAGVFVDQRWLCLVPGLFPDVCVLRHAGVNAGHWSLVQCAWECRSTGAVSTSDAWVDGDPLLLFHFSLMTPRNPAGYLEAQNRVRVEDIPCLQRLVEGFQRDVRAAGFAECMAWGCGTEKLDDGTPIRRAWREAIRRDEPAFADVANPFAVSADVGLRARYRAVESIAHTWRSEWQVTWERERRLSARLYGLWMRVRGAAGACKRFVIRRLRAG
ncbi:MAG: hypothetical protein ACKOTB_11220 [Planctomycetia bacterium]